MNPTQAVCNFALLRFMPNPDYQVVFWTIILLYQIAAVDVILNQHRSRAVMQFLIR